MRRLSFSFLALNATLFTVLGTRLVREFAERQRLRIELAAGAGYFPLSPPPDLTWASSLLSGAFYTLTLGVGLTLLELLLCTLALHLPRSRTAAVMLLVALSAGLLVLIAGFGSVDPFFTAGIVASPLFAALITLWTARSFPLKGTIHRGSRPTVLVFCLLLPGLAWCSGVRDFTSFRDLVLLSNPPGRIITEAYYRGTVDAARPLESLGQSTFLLAEFDAGSIVSREQDRLRQALLPYGALLVPGSETGRAGDLFLSKENEDGFLLMIRTSKAKVSFSPSHPRISDHLDKAEDPAAGLKLLLVLCLVVLLPLSFLLLASRVLGLLWNPLRFRSQTAHWAAFFLVAIGAGAIALAGPGRSLPDGKDDLTLLADGGGNFVRARAARKLARPFVGQAEVTPLVTLALSSDARSRIYAARALGHIDRPEALTALLTLSRDKVTPVVTASIHGLSLRSGSAARERLVELCNDHPHPYIRNMALLAVKEHGWIAWKK